MNTKVCCPGCLGKFLGTKELPHPYIGAIQGCWELYSEIIAKEFSDPKYFKIHRVTVDSYAAQHIGDQSDRRARQSANLHLIALYLYFEKKSSVDSILKFLKKATTHKMDWPEIKQPHNPKWLTVHDIIPALNAQEHILLVEEWGKSIWSAYAIMHKDIMQTYENFISKRNCS